MLAEDRSLLKFGSSYVFPWEDNFFLDLLYSYFQFVHMAWLWVSVKLLQKVCIDEYRS